MTILLGNYNAKDEENIFQPTIGNKYLHEINNSNRVGVVNFAKHRNPTFESTLLQHRNIYNYNWTSPDGNTNNLIYHFLIDRRRHPSLFNVRSFGAADCDTTIWWWQTLRRD
jgi:hypothetical protein